jgi:hypothetical protein
VPPSLPEARRRWAERLRRIFEVDPLRCPRCAHEMRIVACITQPRVIDRMLTHLRRTAPEPRRSRAPPRRCATASRSLGSGAAGVRACRLVAVALPGPGRATSSRPLIHPG